MMIQRLKKGVKGLFVIAGFALLTACGGTKTVPLTVQSDPLGAHVVLQLNSAVKGNSKDWVYLGKTPLDIKRNVSRKELRRAQSFRLRVMKDGFSDQVRDWNGKDIEAEVVEKGHLYWNPKLVQNN